MNTTLNPVQTAASTKPLWAVVGVLSVAVLGMGGALLTMKSKQAEPVVAAASPAVAAPAAAAASAAIAVPAVEDKAAKAQVEQKPAAPKTIAKPVTPKVAPAPSTGATGQAQGMPGANPPVVVGGGVSQPMVQQAPPAPVKPVCVNCGTVEAVTPIQRQGQASGTGAVAGGVLGAVVGNQVGQGNGKTLATILGGVAGGMAGHSIEKNMKKETVFAVRVHMEDGSTRNLEQATPPAVGARVTVEGNMLRGLDGAILSGPPPATQPRPQAAPANPNSVGG